MRGEYDFSGGERGKYAGRAPAHGVPMLETKFVIIDRSALTTAQLVEISKDHARDTMNRLRPQQDLAPTAVFLLESGCSLLGIPGIFLNDGRSKDVLAEMLADMVRMQKARALSFLVMQWGATTNEPPPGNIRDGASIADRPDKIELVGLMVWDRNGETHHHAQVKRHSHRHPTLGPWHDMPRHALNQSRFGEAILPAFAENN